MKKFLTYGVAALVLLGVGGAIASPEQPAAPITTTGAKSSKPATKPTKPKATPKPKPKATPRPKPKMTSGQENAVDKAESYLDMSGFSMKGLIKQLKFEGYSKADATFAVNHVHVDWNAEAVEKAESYLDMSSFSKSGLVTQLKFEGFTPAQAQRAANKAY